MVHVRNDVGRETTLEVVVYKGLQFSEKKSQKKAFARAEAAVLRLKDYYKVQLHTDCQRMNDFSSELCNCPQQDGILRQVFETAHNMKGQAGSFGYALVTEICDALCEYLQHNMSKNDRCIQVVRRYIRVLSYVVEKDLQGDGAERGVRLLGHLRAMRKSKRAMGFLAV